jgi:cyanate lyase
MKSRVRHAFACAAYSRQLGENPAGDRVKVVMEGKFLPFKKW